MTMCVTVNVCRHVYVYRVRGGVSASRGRNHMCLINLYLCEIGLLLSFLLTVLSSDLEESLARTGSRMRGVRAP